MAVVRERSLARCAAPERRDHVEQAASLAIAEPRLVRSC